MLMPTRLSRRDFGPALLATGVISSALLSSDDAPNVAAAQLPLPEDLLLAALIQLYPSAHFTPARLDGIRAGITRNLQQAAALRAVPLLNSDSPATVFRATVPHGP